MKTYSDERPRSLMPLGDGNWHYHFNIEEVEVSGLEEGDEPRTQFVSDTVLVVGEPTVSKIVAAVVHESYTDEDIALMNAQHQAYLLGLDEDSQDYSTYLSLIVQIRAEVTMAMSNFVSN